MFRKISAIIADDRFPDYFWAASPIIILVIGIIVVTVLMIVRYE